jgi:heme oxygenase
MVNGVFGQELSLMEELKATTFAAHARLHTAPFFAALAACQLPLESYVGQLRALALIHGVLENSLANCSDERVALVWSDDLRKVPLLQQDLRYFEPRSVPDLKQAVAAAIKTDTQIRLWSLERPLALLGCLYVLEGSTLGAAVLRPLIARALLLVDDEGLAYLTSYGTAVQSRWKQFQHRMSALQLTPRERSEVADAANIFFNHLESVFLALYPFQPESKTFLVTTINPEAGQHAVPADPREAEAALRAGDICWERFPYYEQRYGERGWRFSRSDAAWQATLYRYQPTQILQQVRWLARVLAGRGMPTLLLQVQLEILVAELGKAYPERKPDYEKLMLGASELQAARRKHLSDQQLNALCLSFDQAVGPQWSARLPETGALLGCAVADELGGSPRAVSSLLS